MKITFFIKQYYLKFNTLEADNLGILEYFLDIVYGTFRIDQGNKPGLMTSIKLGHISIKIY
jgi:hypothetical protein